jgi:hyaluronate lyase
VPPTAWVGGTTDGEYAAIGQHLRGINSTMTARKSWFCLDDSIVCVGSGITSTDGFPVETTIDSRNLGVGGSPALLVDGKRQPVTQGWTGRFVRARWAHLAGVAGYVFPGRADLRAVREERTGAWRDINAGGPADPITRRYLMLYTDHGNDPTNAGYAYVLLPGADVRTTERRAEDRGWLRILANTAAQQGVRVERLGLTAVNFWAAGQVHQLTASAPASVLVRENRDRTATIVVSDPAREATSLVVRWDHAVTEVLSAPASLAGATTGDALTLTFGDLTGQAGAPQVITVRLG